MINPQKSIPTHINEREIKNEFQLSYKVQDKEMSLEIVKVMSYFKAVE